MSMFPKQSLAIGVNHHNLSRLNLRPCLNDATDVTRALQSIGFDAHISLDANLASMQRSIGKFLRRIQPGSVVFFYFSGHGVQMNGNNYLIPSDALGIGGENLPYTTIDAQALIYKMHERKPRLVVCVLDCCRSDAPMEPLDALRIRGRGIFPGFEPGLAPMEAPPATLIAFACAAGDAASAQSANNRNSLYTYHLLRYLLTPNLDLESLLKYVSRDVERESKNGQIPFRYSSCNEFICLVGGYASKGFKAPERHIPYPFYNGKYPAVPPTAAYPQYGQTQMILPTSTMSRGRFLPTQTSVISPQESVSILRILALGSSLTSILNWIFSHLVQ